MLPAAEAAAAEAAAAAAAGGEGINSMFYTCCWRSLTRRTSWQARLLPATPDNEPGAAHTYAAALEKTAYSSTPAELSPVLAVLGGAGTENGMNEEWNDYRCLRTLDGLNEEWNADESALFNDALEKRALTSTNAP